MRQLRGDAVGGLIVVRSSLVGETLHWLHG